MLICMALFIFYIISIFCIFCQGYLVTYGDVSVWCLEYDLCNIIIWCNVGEPLRQQYAAGCVRGGFLKQRPTARDAASAV